MNAIEARRIIDMAAAARQQQRDALRRELDSLQWDEHGIANEPAPRRRTEPAITVPADERVVVPEGRPEITFTPTCEAADVFRIYRSWHGTNAEEAYANTLKAFGAQQYADVALSIEQCRELLAVEEVKAAMEAWRLSNGEWLEFYCDSDGAGEQEQLNRDALEAERVRHETWLHNLEPLKPGETLGDFAQRAGIDSWYVRSVGGRVHLQWLINKLAKGEVVGET